ncbi:zinc finger C2HC domain-containing protein 1C-like [Montipora foliosa]|uniref:zinc finger C2HC domain-containing protein 1C-like n=1 Tax=Montipora foliosa TaxID=591990 RepID=UPI0035F1A84F
MAQAIYDTSPLQSFQGYSPNAELSSQVPAKMNSTSANVSQVEYRNMSHGRNGPKKRLSRLEMLRNDFNKKLQMEQQEKINKLKLIRQENSTKQIKSSSGGTVREFFAERRALEATQRGQKNPELLPPIESHFNRVKKEKQDLSSREQFRNEQPSVGKRISLKKQYQIPQRPLLTKPTSRTQPMQIGVPLQKRSKGIDRQKPLPPVNKGDSDVVKRKQATPNKRYETHAVLLQNDIEDTFDSAMPIPPIQRKPIARHSPSEEGFVSDVDDSQSTITDLSDMPPNLSRLKAKVFRKKQLSKQKLNIVNHPEDHGKLTDFQKWQMEQDKEREERLKKLKQKAEKSSSEVSLSQKERDLLLKIQEEQSRLESLKQQRKELENQEKRQQEEDEKWLAQKHILEESLLPPQPVEVSNTTGILAPKRAMDVNADRLEGEGTPFTQTYKDTTQGDDTHGDDIHSNFYDEKTEGMGEVAVDVSPCSICGRRFALDRLAKHEKVCTKAAHSKRKVYDTRKHRSKGTDHEQYVASGKYLEEPKKRPKADWRAQHDNFIKAIRYAKGLSDEPPPPAENPDYVQCPHCKRKFNSAAAERHIPKCKDIKAKPSRLTKKR